MLKLSILITFIALVISLFSSLFIVYKDKGQTRRPLIALSIRVGLAFLLILQIAYGLFSGQIGSHAPWDSFPAKADSQGQAQTVQTPDTPNATDSAIDDTLPVDDASEAP